MEKAVSTKKNNNQHATISPESTRHTPPRLSLPLEVIYIIFELLKGDKAALRACSLAAHDFSRAALACLGRHITVNYVPRIKMCAQLLTADSAFRHVRSLDLGVTSGRSKPTDYLKEQFTILEIFSQRRTLTRLWLSRFPFPSFESSQRENVQDIVASLGTTVEDLGLYECHFLSRDDIISFICAFPRCHSLYVRDCVAINKESTETMFAGLPKHKLFLDTLELASKGKAIDVSSVIEEADLNISKLSALICNVDSAKQAHSVVTAASASPIRHLELTCVVPDGFQGICETVASQSLLSFFFVLIQAFLKPLPKKWCLEYLTIRSPARSDLVPWHSAFQDFPALPYLKELTIVYHYHNTPYDTHFWTCLDRLFEQRVVFPQSVQVDIRMTTQSKHWDKEWQREFLRSLTSLSKHQLKLWGVHLAELHPAPDPRLTRSSVMSAITQALGNRR
ncbi:hypothetical protein BJ322DRAFT_1071448 [Thelephora terrestris]|uniref:Uncharacterized protein n=1 Tax=Thelephora terrestris TaxID=56493 RepID=A0A9P6HC41_9AGAM|nr:hypothetical protein BJ322DRAFT_1071448 [Thelephora terrestris]